jgi:carbon monoxide dehydrogenase subunit G
VKHVEHAERIGAEPDRLFAFLTDLDNLPRWQSGVESAKQTTPGPIRVGSIAFVRRRLAGQELAVDLEVAVLEPPRRLVLSSEASGFRVEASLDLRPLDGTGTRLAFAMAIEATNLFMRPMEGMVASAAEQDIRDSLLRVRDLFAEG